MRLNGWQRIGVIASAVWIVGGFLWGNSWYLSAQNAPVVSAYHQCEDIAELRQSFSMRHPQDVQETKDARKADDVKCQNEMEYGLAAARAQNGRWIAALLFAIIPPLLAWGLAWLAARLYRWVRAGFASPQL